MDGTLLMAGGASANLISNQFVIGKYVSDLTTMFQGEISCRAYLIHASTPGRS